MDQIVKMMIFNSNIRYYLCDCIYDCTGYIISVSAPNIITNTEEVHVKNPATGILGH